MSRGSRRGFSLVEALVAVAVTGVGVTAALGGLRAIASGDARVRQIELMQRLANEKFEEVLATGEHASAPLSGTFEDRGLEGYAFTVDTEPSSTENLQIIRVVVRPADEENPMRAQATGLTFVPPATGEGGA